MRYDSDHKAKTRERIVKNASRRFRAEGLTGPGVARLMKSTGLTHGGFYKHFGSKDDLLVEAVEEGVNDIGSRLIEWATEAPVGTGWKEIVRKYLSFEHCEHPEWGCPLAALAPDIARTPAEVKRKIDVSMKTYRKQIAQFMPGKTPVERERNCAVILSTMVGATSVARTMADFEGKKKLLSTVRDHLLNSF